MVHSEVLGRALQKVRSLLQGDMVHFEPSEIRELYQYTTPLIENKDLPEQDRHVQEQVYAVVRDHWPETELGPVPQPLQERQQHGFRASLDKFLQGRYEDVTKDDLARLRAAYLRMAGLPKRAESHLRLMRMMAEGLARYKAYLRRNKDEDLATEAEPLFAFAPEPGGSSEAPFLEKVSPPATRCSSDELFGEATRAEVEKIGPFPANLRVRIRELEGEHVVTGEIPEGCMLRVQEGGVHVEGPCNGHIEATGDIVVDGAVAEGWLYSGEGNITCGRVMSSARLFAPHGQISAESGEGLAFALAQGAVQFSGHLRGGQVAGRSVTVADDISSAQIHCTGIVKAAHLGERGQVNTRIVLGRFIDFAVFGAEHEDEEFLSNLRELHKATMQANGCATVTHVIQEDMHDRMRAILFQERVAAHASYSLEQVRAFQKQVTYLGGLTAVAQAYYCGVLEALELPEREMNRCVGALVEITTRLLARLDQEMVQNVAFKNPEVRNVAGQAGRHVSSAMKKCREMSREGGGSLAPLDTLASRIDEFQRDIEAAQVPLRQLAEEYGREMGAFLEERTGALETEVQNVLNEPGKKNALGREARLLADSLPKQKARAKAAGDEWREAETVLDETRRGLAASGGIVFPETWPQRARIEAGSVDSGVIVAVSPLRDSATGQPLGCSLQLQPQEGVPAVCERWGHTCRVMNEKTE